MILHFNTSTLCSKGDTVLLVDGTNLSVERNYFDISMNLITLALKMKGKVFDTWCIDDIFEVMEHDKSIRCAKLQHEDNSQFVLKDKDLRKALIQLEYQAVMYYKDSQAFVLMLNDVEVVVLKAYFDNKTKKFNLN